MASAMVDYGKEASRVGNEMLRLLDRIVKERASWHTAEQWQKAMAEYGALYKRFMMASMLAKMSLDGAERNFQITIGQMSQAFYRWQLDQERAARP